MVERLAALKDATDSLEFWGNKAPKCPHCGHECDIGRNEWWRIYEEGRHDVTCPMCDHDFTVSTRVGYTFCTDVQE